MYMDIIHAHALDTFCEGKKFGTKQSYHVHGTIQFLGHMTASKCQCLLHSDAASFTWRSEKHGSNVEMKNRERCDSEVVSRGSREHGHTFKSTGQRQAGSERWSLTCSTVYHPSGDGFAYSGEEL